jgi:hypothetical protein
MDQLPFYITNKLSDEENNVVKEHLAACPTCQKELDDWQAVAESVRSYTLEREIPLPPISPLIPVSLHRRPTLWQAFRSAANMILAQRVIVTRLGVLPAVLLVILLAPVSTLLIPNGNDLILLPMLALVPIAAVCVTAFLAGPETDPCYEIISATPMYPSTILFARLTLTLSLISCTALLGSLVISMLTPSSLIQVVSVWLGPMLLLSAITTVLALIWSPTIAASIAITLWTIVIFIIVGEHSSLSKLPKFMISLQPLLHLDWWRLSIQVVVAAVIWIVGRVLLSRDMTLPRDWGTNT